MGHFRKTLSILYSKCERCTASVRRGFAKTSAHLFLNSEVANGKGRSAMRNAGGFRNSFCRILAAAN